MSIPDNPTRRAIAEAIEQGGRDVELRCNPAFSSLNTSLIEAMPGDVLVAFDAGTETTQGNGVVGGGTIANLLDSGMAIAVLSKLNFGQTCSTISLTVNMMRSAAAGRLYVRANVEKLGRRVAFANARLLDEHGGLFATATSSLAVIS